MPEVGLEPTSLAAHDFESCAYAIPPLRRVNEIHGTSKKSKNQSISHKNFIDISLFTFQPYKECGKIAW